MSGPVDPLLLVPRTCATHNNQGGERESRPLSDFREAPAYVLLGDPGAGKTCSFEQEARVTGGHYVQARSFAALDPSPELSGKTLFIDGLDEMRAGGGDGRTPLDHVRRRLDRLGRPPFRLSCREADWYGASDHSALREVAPEGVLNVLHLDPLNREDILLLLERRFAVASAAGFARQADRHGLTDLLCNPQTLGLLAKAVGGGDWPDSRAATYELACQQLLREANREHRTARRDSAPTEKALLDATGFLCAVHLLSGIAGFAADDDAADAQHILWRELSAPPELPIRDALTSGLFQRDDRLQQRIPVHRSIAEFLGARYLAQLIDDQGLPLGRVVALLAGEDGGIPPDLRGLAAWLALHCRSAREELIDRDPLGVVLYGDVRGFSTDDKHRVLAALKAEAERYANFRFEAWTATPFGALATPDMVPKFLESLTAPSRAEADIALLDCVLDALRYGPPLAELAAVDELPLLDVLLDTVARDASYPSHIRHNAVKILLRDRSGNGARLVSLAGDVRVGTVEDGDDQLLGLLLTDLFPEFIGTEEVLDFLHPEKQDCLLGDYEMFWSHHLLEKAPNDLIPELLDQLVIRAPVLRESPDYHETEMVGGLLVRALETHGDTIDDMRLYDWLGTGLGRYEQVMIDSERKGRVTAWLEAHPERYKGVLLAAVERCVGEEDGRPRLFHTQSHLYEAEPPADFVAWCLERAAAEAQSEIKHYFFNLAMERLIRQGGKQWPTLDALDQLGPWMAEHPEFEPVLESYTSLPIDHWRKENAAKRRKRDKDRKQRKEDWHSKYQEYFDTIREGSAPPHILHDLAQVYLLKHVGETPREKLDDFLNGDQELVDAAYNGFRRSLDRDDLPSMAEIIDLEASGRMHFIRQPCLAGMVELYRDDPQAAQNLDDEVLRKLIAFRLTWHMEMEGGGWFAALARARHELVAEVLVVYVLQLLRKGREHLFGIWQLASDNDYAMVARVALPTLLERFPLRPKNKQLAYVLDPLLKAGLRHLESPTLAGLVAMRLTKSSMSAAQRVYWLACGLMLSPGEYEKALREHIGASKALRAHLGAFLHNLEGLPDFPPPLPVSSMALLIELLAPDSPPEDPMSVYRVSRAMETAREVRGFIDALGGNPSKAAAEALNRLIVLPELAPWLQRLRHAAQTQRIAQRKASTPRLGAAEICRTLANREPANAADLAALTHEHLCDLARKMRDGSTNDYRQYWSLDKSNNKPARPKPENDCRDALLSDLKERLGRLGIDAIKEGYYAEDKRADIRVSSGGATSFNVPIEVKRERHDNLWRAIQEQLIERYVRDPGTDGFGIYVVFWFGGEGMPLPQEGKKPRNAAELEKHLCSMLTVDEARHISVCVIDCALP